MTLDLLRQHERRAREEQWKLEELPWQEPLKFCGATSREKALCKLDCLTVSEAMFLFELGIRRQLGENMRHLLQMPEPMLGCIRWHDIDTLRHLWSLRSLLRLVQETDPPVRERKREAARMLEPSTLPSSRHTAGFAFDARAIDLLIRASLAHHIYERVGKGNRVPHMRAVFSSCARDSLRHEEYLVAWLKYRMGSRDRAYRTALQAAAVRWTSRTLSVFRPSLRALAEASNTTRTEAAAGLFGALSKTLRRLGPCWNDYPARLVHDATRSPWLVWVLR